MNNNIFWDCWESWTGNYTNNNKLKKKEHKVKKNESENNLKEFKELIKKYREYANYELLEKEYKKIFTVLSKDSHNIGRILMERLTGFSSLFTCTLCRAVDENLDLSNPNCDKCIYKIVTENKCNEGKNKKTYLNIFNAETIQEVISAILERANYMEKILEKYEEMNSFEPVRDHGPTSEVVFQFLPSTNYFYNKDKNDIVHLPQINIKNFYNETDCNEAVNEDMKFIELYLLLKAEMERSWKGEEIDWDNDNQEKYAIYFEKGIHLNVIPAPDFNTMHMNICFKSFFDCAEAINKYGDKIIEVYNLDKGEKDEE